MIVTLATDMNIKQWRTARCQPTLWLSAFLALIPIWSFATPHCQGERDHPDWPMSFNSTNGQQHSYSPIEVGCDLSKTVHFPNVSHDADEAVNDLKQPPYYSLLIARSLAAAEIPNTADPDALAKPLDDSRHFNFRLTIKKGGEVCTAYLKRLNEATYHQPPYCGLQEVAIIPGFRQLPIRHLTVAEYSRLFISAHTLIYGQPTNWVPSVLGRQSYEPSAWVYEPAVDVENNGKPDRIVIWDEDDARYSHCGIPVGPKAIISRGSHYGLIENSDKQSVDALKTAEVFGQSGLKASDRHPSKYQILSINYRPIGTTISIFQFRNSTYFDTFYDTIYHAAVPRGASVPLGDHLGVYIRRNGETQEVCEYEVTDLGDYE